MLGSTQIRRARSTRHAPLELRGRGRAAPQWRWCCADEPSGPSVLFIERAQPPGRSVVGPHGVPGRPRRPGRCDEPRARPSARHSRRWGSRSAGAELIGRLDDRQGNPRTHPDALDLRLRLRAAGAPALLRRTTRCSEAFWFPLRALLEPRAPRPVHARTRVRVPRHPGRRARPPRRLGAHLQLPRERSSARSGRRCPTAGPRRCAATRAELERQWTRQLPIAPISGSPGSNA